MNIKYTCSECGKEHEEWPALAYISPSSYDELSDVEKNKIAEINNDFCIIIYPDQTDRFIRCTLTQKVTDHCENLEYGVWVSLSEKSFNDYKNNFKNDNHQAEYFGWLNTLLPDYTFNESVPTTVFTKTGNSRPEIVPHKEVDHPFVHDYYNGITKKEAERRIENMIKIVESNIDTTRTVKPWWKFW